MRGLRRLCERWQLTINHLAKAKRKLLFRIISLAIARLLFFLEEYLDTSDFIRIYKMQDFGSLIKADFFIEATKIERNTTVYIFIRKRVENDNFVIVSFFKKAVVYKGTAAYWMIKKKTVGDSEVELYRNQNYRE